MVIALGVDGQSIGALPAQALDQIRHKPRSVSLVLRIRPDSQPGEVCSKRVSSGDLVTYQPGRVFRNGCHTGLRQSDRQRLLRILPERREGSSIEFGHIRQVILSHITDVHTYVVLPCVQPVWFATPA